MNKEKHSKTNKATENGKKISKKKANASKNSVLIQKVAINITRKSSARAKKTNVDNEFDYY